MIKTFSCFSLLFLAVPLFSATPIPVQHVIGTEPLPFATEAQPFRFDGALFGAFQQQLGARGGDDKTVSTSFLQAELRHDFGHLYVAGRATGSLEPATNADPYPALFHTEADREGNRLVDQSSGRRYLTEAAVEAGFQSGWFGAQLYAAPVGVPAFGPQPTRLRASAAGLALTTLADAEHSFADQATSVITAGATFGPVTVEGSRFKTSLSGDDFKADDGDDATAVRARLRLGVFDLAVSRAEIDDVISSSRTNATVTVGTRSDRGGVAATLSATEMKDDLTSKAMRAWLGEIGWQFGSNLLSGRYDRADRAGLFTPQESPLFFDRTQRVGAVTLGYARELLRTSLIVTLGGELTYFQQPRSFEPFYGHKPQGSAIFVKLTPRNSILALRR